jgi:TrmH family RNA methyltransferase
MLSKSRITLITSLKQKKYRLQHQLFVVEGIKTINEFLNSSYVLDHLYAIDSFENVSNESQTIVSEKELKKISFLKKHEFSISNFQNT